MLNIGWWCSIPRSEVKGALGSIPMVYCFFIIFAVLDFYFCRTENIHPPHHHIFLLLPPAHSVVLVWWWFIVTIGMNMSQVGQRRWGRLPFYIITIMYQKFLCKNWIQRLVRVDACPKKISTGHSNDPNIRWNDTLYTMGYDGGGEGGGLWLRAPNRPILGLALCRQRPHCQVCRSLLAPYPSPLYILEGGSHYCHSPLVSFLQVPKSHSTGLTRHPHCIIDFGTETHPIKEARHNLQCHLEAVRLWWIQESVIRIKKSASHWKDHPNFIGLHPSLQQVSPSAISQNPSPCLKWCWIERLPGWHHASLRRWSHNIPLPGPPSIGNPSRYA